MTTKTKKSAPAWGDVKTKLADFDRAGLLSLVHDLYGASKDNQAFLHTRFSLDGDVLKRYKTTIARWLWPDPFKNQNTSVAKAKKAISDFKKAIGEPAGVAELMLFYCEQAAGFSNDVALQDDGYFDTLVRMFEQATKASMRLQDAQRDAFIARLDVVRRISHNFGYGVGDDMDCILDDYGVNAEA